MPDQIYTASERGRLHARVLISLGNGDGGFGDQIHKYMRTLEQIAKAAETHYNNPTPTNSMVLHDALDKVDWMRE